MIYPNDYTSYDLVLEDSTVFVIMPFAEEYNAVFAEIKQTCIEMMLECKRADDYFSNRAIMENILHGITSSELIIVDLTGLNANVFYELGIAHSLRNEDSIILITQEIDKCPFDITHRSILVYDKRNLIKFKESLKKKIFTSRESSAKKEFYKMLLKNNQIPSSEIREFIEIGERFSKERFNLVYKSIAKKMSNIDSQKTDEIMTYFTKLEEYKNGAIKNSSTIVKLNFLTSIPVVSNIEYIKNSVLKQSQRDLINIDDPNSYNFIVDFCFTMIRQNKAKVEAVDWLVDYLHNYRMGRIDVIRTKIEDFFIEIEDKYINKVILSMLNSRQITVRESAADICGQKKLLTSIPKLINLLNEETNPHVVRSCITALARLNAKEASFSILEWMKKNQDKWGTQAVSASLRNIAVSALKTLDKEGEYLEEMLNLPTS